MIKTGSSDGAIMHLRRADVTQLYRTGGVFLRSSKEELTLEELKNVLHVLDSLSVRYLVTLGSAVTAQSALRLWELAKEMEYPLSVVHVPKTIFNDLPLPPNSLYYGHATAVEVGTQLLNQLSTDAKSTERFFVAVSIGQRAGHLALSMGRASSAMLTVIPEEFPDGLAPEALLRTLEAAIIKRIMSDHSYGVIVLAEGLADKMARQARLEFFGTDDLDTAHQELGRNVVKELIK
jgi:6-phosphofructokinase 1